VKSDLYRPFNIVIAVYCRRARWSGHVAGLDKTRTAYRILVEKLLENSQRIERPTNGGVGMELAQ
jgi:hypothetical protein